MMKYCCGETGCEHIYTATAKTIDSKARVHYKKEHPKRKAKFKGFLSESDMQSFQANPDKPVVVK